MPILNESGFRFETCDGPTAKLIEQARRSGLWGSTESEVIESLMMEGLRSAVERGLIRLEADHDKD